METNTQTVFIEMECEDSDKTINVKKERSPTPEPAASTESDNRVRLKCAECSKIFYCVEKMACHMRRHLGQNPFQCAMCTYDTYNKTLFMEHVNGHLGVKPFKCGKCDYRSVSKKYIKMHEAKHATCDVCGHVARNRVKLTHHREQTGCGMSETDKLALSKKKKKKKLEKKNVLEEQNEPKAEDSPLSSREGSTSPPQKVACNKCDKLLLPDLLKEHLRMKHGIKKKIVKGKLFKCKVCEYKTSSLAKTLLHLIHHPQEVLPSVDVTPLVDCGFIASH